MMRCARPEWPVDAAPDAEFVFLTGAFRCRILPSPIVVYEW